MQLEGRGVCSLVHLPEQMQVLAGLGNGEVVSVDPASGEVLIKDSCGTWSKVVAGPMRYVDPAMDERTVYLIDNLIIPQQWCNNGL